MLSNFDSGYKLTDEGYDVQEYLTFRLQKWLFDFIHLYITDHTNQISIVK